ncbi:haloacid dehalogenase type II [Candidatus Spongiihabitans sp.]|uniref:haloacid dehalogenase type II n=1 Tax=Candidatus Spongiihabitans sp. TaxID=3101308 RepID=UPI003C7A3307
MVKKLTRFSTLSFDCYGTLIDWESGIWDALQPLIVENHRHDITRDRGLGAFARAESAQEKATPSMIYPEVLRNAHGAIANQFNLKSTDELDEAFGRSVPHWPAFPDSADALRILKQHFKLVILSNINNAGFAASNTKLGVEFDAIYTAEAIGAYKPDLGNFEYLIRHLRDDLGVDADDILHTAQSLFHDHAPANEFGLSNVWIDRQHLNQSDNWGATPLVENRPVFDFLFNAMAQMADAVQQEVGI